MARDEAAGDTSWSDDGDHGYCSDGAGGVRGEGSGESVFGVTEVGSNGNTATKQARWGDGKDWLSTLTTEGEGAVDAGDEEEAKASAGECVASSPVWLLTARLGWLLLGFVAGAALATTVLFLKHDGYPETCTVPT